MIEKIPLEAHPAPANPEEKEYGNAGMENPQPGGSPGPAPIL